LLELYSRCLKVVKGREPEQTSKGQELPDRPPQGWTAPL
jgi:hypothetical protein